LPQILKALKKSNTSDRFEPTNLRSNGKHTNHYTTDATSEDCSWIQLESSSKKWVL
jgi:hypothetical protein